MSEEEWLRRMEREAEELMTELTASEASDLLSYEIVIERGLQTFAEVARAASHPR
jgi:hypothetical protein